jgi:hypothetical protein
MERKSLPAAATTTPLLTAQLIARFASSSSPTSGSAWTPGSASRLRLITSAP